MKMVKNNNSKMKCSICNSYRTQVVKKVQSPFIDKKYTLYFCNDCKSYFFNSKQYNLDIERLYNDKNFSLTEEITYSRYLYRQVKRIEKLIGSNKKPLNILDIGCRTGDFLCHWPKGNNLYGVELNKDFADVAQKRGIKIYNDFIENINFTIKFDVVTCYAILEHIQSPHKLLEKIVSLIKDGGILVIMIPTIECKLREKLDKKNIHWHMYSPPEHLAYYSRTFLDNFMNKHQLKLKYRYYTAGGLNRIYSKQSKKYKLLKKEDFESLNEYFLHKIDNNVHRTFIRKLRDKLISCKRLLIEEYLPINKYPYYDHMYSYYKKVEKS